MLNAYDRLALCFAFVWIVGAILFLTSLPDVSMQPFFGISFWLYSVGLECMSIMGGKSSMVRKYGKSKSKT